MYGGSVRLKTPMMYALGFIGLFTVGGLTGLPLAAMSTDIPLHDTYFVVAHFHYVMMGSMLFGFLAGMYYWFPKMFGKMYSERWGIFFAVVIYIGFNLAFFPQFLAGTQGMPRRYASYPDGFQIYHVLSSIGAYIMGAGLVGVLFNWLAGLKNGAIAAANPWGANTLEWQTTSPPPHDNFPNTMTADDPYDVAQWKQISENEWQIDPDYRPDENRGHH
jgi:cytochrome c oxidase subunit 1